MAILFQSEHKSIPVWNSICFCHEISEPLRLEIIRQLHARGEATCSSLDMPIKVQTVSHHMNILREAGMISTRLVGTARPSTLRKKELDQRFPGFMDTILIP